MSLANPYNYSEYAVIVDLYNSDMTYIKSFQWGIDKFLECSFSMDKNGCKSFSLLFAKFQNIEKYQIVRIRIDDVYFFTGIICETSLESNRPGDYFYSGYGLIYFLKNKVSEFGSFSSDLFLVVGYSGADYLIIYKGNNDIFTKIADPTSLPSSTSYAASFSLDGKYFAVGNLSSPYIAIYKRNDDNEFVKLSNPADLPTSAAYGVSFSSNGMYIAVAHITHPHITIYKKEDESTFVKLDDPADLPVNGRDCAFSFDGAYLAVCGTDAPYLIIYKRTEDTFLKLDDPADLPTSSCSGIAFSFDGVYLVVTQRYTPYLIIYKRTGDEFVKLDDPADLPTGWAWGSAFSLDGTYLAISHEVTPYLIIYKRTGDEFIKLDDPTDLPAGGGNEHKVSFSLDGVYLAVTHHSTPYATVYKRINDTFIKLTNPADLPASAGYGVAFSFNSTVYSILSLYLNQIKYYNIPIDTTMENISDYLTEDKYKVNLEAQGDKIYNIIDAIRKIANGIEDNNYDDGINDDLIGYWKLDESSGLIAYDSSGYGNDGTLDATMTDDDWIAGKSGNALDFDGSDDNVNAGNASPLDTIGSGDFSISFWMKYSGAALNYDMLFSKRVSDAIDIYICSYIANNRILFAMYSGGASASAIFTNSNPFDGSWHHVAVVIDRTGDKAFCYVDNVKDTVEGDLSALPSDCSNAGDVYFGLRGQNDSLPYEGALDEVRIYNKALTQSEVNALYHNPDGLYKNDYIFGIDEERKLFFKPRSTDIKKVLSVGARGNNGINEYRPSDSKKETGDVYTVEPTATVGGKTAATENRNIDYVKTITGIGADSVTNYTAGLIYDLIRAGKEATIMWKIEKSSPLLLKADGVMRIISGDIQDDLLLNTVDYKFNKGEKVREIRIGGIDVPETTEQIVKENIVEEKTEAKPGLGAFPYIEYPNWFNE